jgi:hypothetical protein
VEVTAGGGTRLLAGHQRVTITDGVIGLITTLTDKDLEQLGGDLNADRLLVQSPSGSSSGAGGCMGKIYPAVKSEDADSVISVTGKGMPIGFEQPTWFIPPISQAHEATPGVTRPALAR